MRPRIGPPPVLDLWAAQPHGRRKGWVKRMGRGQGKWLGKRKQGGAAVGQGKRERLGATGEGAETGEEADEIMTPIEESNVIDLDSETQGQEELNIGEDDLLPNTTNRQRKRVQASTSSLVAHAKKRMMSKDVLADSVAKMASSFQEFIRTSTQKLDVREVYDEITAIPDLSEDEELKACAWFIENEKQFQMLKKVPATRKKSMVLMFISQGA
uniref:Uncharacterized protein n=1 Tax=Fagus sylvatica TaxID=28930 RepID=A0A2N9EKA0_FAGSY